MEIQDEKNTKSDVTRKKTLFVWYVIVAFSQILAGAYTLLSFFSLVPFSVPILFIWIGFLLIVNTILLYIAYINRKRLDIRTKISLVLWSSVVIWYWAFSPLFYVFSTYYTQAQLKVASLNYFWEASVLGCICIFFCLLFFNPMYHYLVGKKSSIKSPQDAYDFLNRFAYGVGITSVLFATFGFIIGSFQQGYFAQMSVFEQIKLIFHGIVLSLLSGLYVKIILDNLFNVVRFQIRTKNPSQTLVVGRFSQKIFRENIIVTIASVGIMLIVGAKISQNIIRDIVTNNISSSFEDVFAYLDNDISMGANIDKNYLQGHFGNKMDVFISNNDLLNKKSFAPETLSYIKSHKDGEIEDDRYELKMIIFRTDPKTFTKDFVVVYLSDHYASIFKYLIDVGFASILVIVFASLLMYLFTNTIRNSLLSIQKAIRNRGEDILSFKLSTGDEFEELADNLSAYANLARDSQFGLEEKVLKKTADLNKKMEEFQKTNSSLENMDKAMINILEDAKEVEELLKVEKAGVEKKVEERTLSLSKAKDEVTQGWMLIQKEKARLSSSIQSLSLGFIMTDTSNNVVLSNPALEKIFEFTDSKWTLSDITKGVAGKIDIVAQCEKCMKEKKTIEMKDISFGSKYLRIFMAPIVDQGNLVIGSVILVEDITEAKVLERSRDEFFSIASHELRTPLTSIKGNTSMIQQYYSDKIQDKDLKEMIEDIHESSIRLIDIVNDFLDMSRLEQGRIEFKNEIFDAVPLVEQVVYDIAKLADEKKIFVKFDQPKVILPKVFADSARTKQIIFNLLGNAIKFTANGGVNVAIDTKDKFLYIHVTDTGQGIPTTSQSLLFRKFVQAENNILTRDGTKGTGLGLYISKLMADGMGGTIFLENSVENKGSTFTVTLPLATGKEKETVKKEKPASAESFSEAKKDTVSAEAKPVYTNTKTEDVVEGKAAKKTNVIEADKHEVEEIKREVELVEKVKEEPEVKIEAKKEEALRQAQDKEEPVVKTEKKTASIYVPKEMDTKVETKTVSADTKPETKPVLQGTKPEEVIAEKEQVASKVSVDNESVSPGSKDNA